jgi:TonB family protein
MADRLGHYVMVCFTFRGIDMTIINSNANEILPRFIRNRVHVWSMPGRFAHSAIGVVFALAMTSLSVITALAQQPARQPQQAQAPAAAPATAVPAPAPSAAPVASPAMASWQQALIAQLDRFKRYPAQAHGAEGVVSLGFRIDRQGKLVNSRIEKSSGSLVLDAEALAMIKRASPLPRPPSGIADDDLSIVIPIQYVAGKKS